MMKSIQNGRLNPFGRHVYHFGMSLYRASIFGHEKERFGILDDAHVPTGEYTWSFRRLIGVPWGSINLKRPTARRRKVLIALRFPSASVVHASVQTESVPYPRGLITPTRLSI